MTEQLVGAICDLLQRLGIPYSVMRRDGGLFIGIVAPQGDAGEMAVERISKLASMTRELKEAV